MMNEVDGCFDEVHVWCKRRKTKPNHRSLAGGENFNFVSLVRGRRLKPTLLNGEKNDVVSCGEH